MRRSAFGLAALLIAGCGEAPKNPILEVARDYPKYGRIDDALRRAPELCYAPPPATLRKSSSSDTATHGRKLYYLHAKNAEAYLRASELPQPGGQAIVKESLIDGNPGPLFLMIKGSDGWTYATTTPDGKTVTASGKIASCVKCHQDAPHDGLFGLTPAAEARVLEAAGEFRGYSRIDDHLRVAPGSCSGRPFPLPRKSLSRDLETHGQKLYFLHAKNAEAYRQAKDLDQPVGQTLVKESFIDGKPGLLFLMIKDESGWTYATTTPDGKTVTESGKIASCLKCHQDAPRDSLFGLSTR